ncbi:MAG: apolipoprotein N-acyltransferase [Verrucomicrobiales bacterium]|nr:apolipoprotein N-acyltransferase [Verrucomicrobiales bacterium]MDP6752403.1 apolipoprotein N-acyltransferase [Verrucomicrobiota bacterium]
MIGAEQLGQARWLLAALVGLALAMAFPEPRWFGLAWLVPGVWLAVVAGERRWRLFGLAFVAALVFRLVSLRFLLAMPHTAGAISGWLALSFYSALYPAVWGWFCGGWLRDGLAKLEWPWFRRLGFGLFAAAAWVALEMVQARLLGGYPWNFLGVSQFENLPLIQVASITGVYGVSFLVAWASVSLLFAVLQIRRSPANPWSWSADLALPLLALGLVCTWGIVRIGKPPAPADRLTVALVQPSIPQRLIWQTDTGDERLAKVLELSRLALATKPDLLLWPEACAPISAERWPEVFDMVKSSGVPLLFGADDVERDGEAVRFYNSAVLLASDGPRLPTYRKRRLVMFGEYIPFEKALPFMKYLSPIGGSFTAGTEPVQFTLPDADTKLSPLICFEDAFPHGGREHVSPETALLVNLTNDGWFGAGPEQWQHAANAVFRAVENGVPLVRCANNGLTCWIDPLGRVRQYFGQESGDIYGAGFVSFDVPLGQALGQTTYNRHGDLFGWACLVVAVVVGAARRLAKRGLHTGGGIG